MTIRKTKAPAQSYENFCKVFAGVFMKHAKTRGTFYTCYIRHAIDAYCVAGPDRRHFLSEDAQGEDACGYRIARALMVQGWDEDTIIEYSTTQQRYVDAVDRLGFDDVLERVGYSSAKGFARHSNGLRYAWLMDGAPEIEPLLDEDDED